MRKHEGSRRTQDLKVVQSQGLPIIAFRPKSSSSESLNVMMVLSDG